MTDTDTTLEPLAERLAAQGRDALVERLRGAYTEAAAAHSDIVKVDDDRIEQLVQEAAERADGLQWRRALAIVASRELGIDLNAALSHPAVALAQTKVGAPSYEESLAELVRSAPVPVVPPPVAPVASAPEVSESEPAGPAASETETEPEPERASGESERTSERNGSGAYSATPGMSRVVHSPTGEAVVEDPEPGGGYDEDFLPAPLTAASEHERAPVDGPDTAGSDPAGPDPAGSEPTAEVPEPLPDPSPEPLPAPIPEPLPDPAPPVPDPGPDALFGTELAPEPPIARQPPQPTHTIGGPGPRQPEPPLEPEPPLAPEPPPEPEPYDPEKTAVFDRAIPAEPIEQATESFAAAPGRFDQAPEPFDEPYESTGDRSGSFGDPAEALRDPSEAFGTTTEPFGGQPTQAWSPAETAAAHGWVDDEELAAPQTGEHPVPLDEPLPLDDDDYSRLRVTAYHLGGVANLPTNKDGIDVQLSDSGLDILRADDQILGRLGWTEIEALEVPLPRGRLRRNRNSGKATLVVRTRHGDASFEVPGFAPEELRERIEPIMERFSRLPGPGY